MNTNTQLHTKLSDSTAIEHASKEIARIPRMKKQVAAMVARNLDELLKELKSCGVPMHAVCREVPLGDPQDKDPKALYKYRNPKGSEPRNYVTKSSRYFDIASAISRIPGHPLTGFTGELLRRVFEGTPYAPARSSAESVAVRLKTVLDKSVEKIAQYINLHESFEQLAHIRHSGQIPLQAKDQYLAAINEEQYTHCVPQLELGYFYQHLCDDLGNFLYLETENDGNYWLASKCKVTLFIGLDDNSEPRPFLIYKTRKGFHAIRDDEAIALELYQDAPRTWGIMFYGKDQRQFLLGAELYRLSVKFHEEYDPIYNKVSSVAAEHYYEQREYYSNYQDHPFEIYYEGYSEFELDREWEWHRSSAINEYLTQKFFNANPKFKSKYIEGKDAVDFSLVTVDALERFEANIESFGSLTPGSDNGVLELPPNTPLLFGDGALGRIMGWFTGGATLSLELEHDICELVGEDLENNSYAPPYGWYSVSLDPGSWSAADLLWLHSKIFATKINSLFQATRPQEKQLEQFLSWLEDDQS